MLHFQNKLFSPAIILILTFGLVLLWPRLDASAQESPTPVKIGVLAKRGAERCQEKWGPTTEYLTSQISGYSFIIVPLRFGTVNDAVERKEVDFILANSAIYVELEILYGVKRIATLKNLRLGKALTVFGGVIFHRADRKDISDYNSIKGKTFMAVDETSFGGWLTAWRELKEKGIDPHRDFADLRFGGTHDAVVYAVRDGEVDAGSVRTDTLERMAAEGKIRLEDFRVIHEHGGGLVHLPFQHSTRSYPEWPMAKVGHTSDDLAEKVTISLVKMSLDSAAAKVAKCAGWTIPGHYQPVRECLKELRVGPYKDYGKITFRDVFRNYWHWFIGALFLMAYILFVAAYVVRINRRLHKAVEAERNELTERKKAEEVLRESVEKFKSLYTSMNEGMALHKLLYDTEGKAVDYILEDVNPAFETILGLNADNVQGRKASIVYSTAVAPYLDVYANVVKTGQSTQFETEFIPVEKCFSIKVFSPDKEHFATVFEDITEQKRAEDALQQSEERFRSIVTNSNELISLTDAEGNIEYLSPKVESVTGYTAEKFIGTKLPDIIHPDDVDRCARAWQELFEGKSQLENFEYRIIDPNGKTRWISHTARLVPVGGKRSGIQSNLRNITERKRAKEALRESTDKFKALFNNAQVALFRTSISDGHLLEVNERYANLAGYSNVEDCMAEFVALKSWVNPDLRGELLQTLQEKGSVSDYEAEFTRCDEKNIWISFSATIYPAQGFIEGSIVDITERKRTEEEKVKLEGQLRQSQKMESVGRLAGGVAHDFNNILTGINGYAEMILDGLEVDDPLRPNMEVILSSGKRAAGLTAQLLAFSRKQIIAPKVIAPNDILLDSQKMLRRIIGEDIDFIFAPGKRLWRINADPTQLDQVMINLAVNARDAMPDGGKLTVETQNVSLDDEYCKSHAEFIPGDYVMLAVTDTGHGMDAETLENIFEPFYSTKEVGKGTGLGLAMVYGVMKQNKGFINVYSEVGVGTTFKIYYPALKEKAEKLPKDKLADMPTGTETVLLVEDEDLVRNLAKAVLERQGYTVIDTSDGEKAHLEYTQYSGKIDLLLTDVIMPKMNGRQLYEKLLGLKPGLKALFVSGYTEDAIAHHGVLDKGTHFLQKPFTIQALAKAVRKALDSLSME